MCSKQAVCKIVHLGVTANLGEVATHQRKIVVLIDSTYSSHSFHGRLIADATSKRVTRVCGIYDYPTASRNSDCTTDQTLLRVRRVNLQVMTHLLMTQVPVIREIIDKSKIGY